MNHLIPVNIEDLVKKLNDPTVNETERGYIYQRLRAIANYTDQVCKEHVSRPVTIPKKTR